MTLRDLIDAAKERKIPLDTEIVIAGETVSGIEVQHGRLAAVADYFGGQTFTVMPQKPRDTVLVFTRRDERSDGNVYPKVV